MTLVLLPTVELEPHDWAEPGYEETLGTPAWNELWQRSLARWRVKPVLPGEWHVSTDSMDSEKTLAKLLTLALHESGVLGFPDADGDVAPDDERVAPLAGGYVLFDERGRAAAVPSCCCDLGDLGAWRRAASLVDGEDPMLGVGHATWSSHRDGAMVILTETPEVMAHPPVTTVLSANELLAATHVAERALEAFRLRLLPSLRRLVEDDARAERLSLLMVGLPIVGGH